MFTFDCVSTFVFTNKKQIIFDRECKYKVKNEGRNGIVCRTMGCVSLGTDLFVL